MDRDDLDRELSRLQEASQRIAADLVELQIDSGRQLLDASPLTGVSADRWATARSALADDALYTAPTGLAREVLG